MTLDFFPLQERNDALSLVIAHIMDGIHSGAFQGDGRIPTELELCDAVGVSRTPVREAVKVLETVGVLEVRRGIGTFLRTDPTAALGQLMMFQSQLVNTSPQKLYEARKMVEGAAARLLAKNRTDEDLEKLRAVNAAFVEVASRPDVSIEELSQADIAFHYACFDLCGNELIGALGRFVTALFAPWISESLRHGGGLRAARNHDILLSMIEMKNPGGAGEATLDRVVEEGLEYWQKSLLAKKTDRSEKVKGDPP